MNPHDIISQRLEAFLKSLPSWCGAVNGGGEPSEPVNHKTRALWVNTVTMALQLSTPFYWLMYCSLLMLSKGAFPINL